MAPRPIRLSRQGTPITHLFFADDLLILAEASCDQAKIIHEVLNTFCASSGEKVNNKKSQVFFSKNVKPPEMQKISKRLGFSITTDLGKYLGMPIIYKSVTTGTYQGILEKVEQRLNGSNAKLLSLAGRVTLAQSVLQALPVYSMQTTRLPNGITNKIDQACRAFF